MNIFIAVIGGLLLGQELHAHLFAGGGSILWALSGSFLLGVTAGRFFKGLED